MTDRFVVRPKGAEKKEDKSVVMTLRLDRTLQEEYALEHLEFIPANDEDTIKIDEEIR